MEDASPLFGIPKSECPDIWTRLPKHKWPKSWSSVEDPVVPLERNLYRHRLAGLLWERQSEKVLLEHCWEKVLNWECLFVNRARGLSLSVYVNGIKLAGKTENIAPTWKILMKDVDLGEQTSLIDHIYWVAPKESAEICSNPGFLLERRKNYLSELHRNLILWHGRSRKEMCGKILRTCE